MAYCFCSFRHEASFGPFSQSRELLVAGRIIGHTIRLTVDLQRHKRLGQPNTAVGGLWLLLFAVGIGKHGTFIFWPKLLKYECFVRPEKN